MNIGNKITGLRKKQGLSQEELAELVGVARQTISKWELEETAPDLKQAKKLSEIFNVSLDELTDNNIKDVIVEKVTNTEKTTNKTFLVLKIIGIVIGLFILSYIILVILCIASKNIKDRGEKISESIHCTIYGEEHSFGIVYYELTGEPIELGGDSYFNDILNLGKYDDAHQIFNVINDYVKKNGGTCHMISENDLSDMVNMTIKEGTLTNKGATIVITTNETYQVNTGESFKIEKYNYHTGDYEELTSSNNCGVNAIGYNISKNKPLELKVDWSCMYNKLDNGIYRIVKDVTFDSDLPIENDNNIYYTYAEFEID